MLVTLKEVLHDAQENKYAVAGFNVFGYEDAISVIRAAEMLKCPVILMTNIDAITHMPVSVMGQMLTYLAKASTTKVCVHLDHGKSIDVIEQALIAGYSSVMYDGSQLPLEENISMTRKVVSLASSYHASVEGEIGCVGYNEPIIGAKASYTNPLEAQTFVEQTGVDAVAVAIGTLHRMTTQEADIQYDLLSAIEERVSIPLVLHGSTGVKDHDLAKLSILGITKVNIGTALRMAFGHSMRKVFEENPNEFDRLKVFKQSMIEVQKIAYEKMKLLGGEKSV